MTQEERWNKLFKIVNGKLAESNQKMIRLGVYYSGRASAFREIQKAMERLNREQR